MSSSELLAERIRRLQKKPEDIEEASQTLKRARLRSKEQFERKFQRRMRNRIFEPGDLVLVRNSRIEMEANRKSKPRYLGPYQVYRHTRGGSYVLQELDGAIWRQPVAAFRYSLTSQEMIQFLKILCKTQMKNPLLRQMKKETVKTHTIPHLDHIHHPFQKLPLTFPTCEATGDSCYFKCWGDVTPQNGLARGKGLIR